MPTTPEPVDVPDSSPEAAPEPLSGKKNRVPLWIGLAVAAVVLVAAAIVLPQVLGGDDGDAAAPTPTGAPTSGAPAPEKITLDDLYKDEPKLTTNDGKAYTLKRIDSWDHDGSCTDAGENSDAKMMLVKCVDRFEAAYETEDGKFLIAQQVFVFHDSGEAYAFRAVDVKDAKFAFEEKATQTSQNLWHRDSVGEYAILTTVGPTGGHVDIDDATKETCKALADPFTNRTVNLIKKKFHW